MTSRRWIILVAGAVAAGATFALFRPDRAFVDQRVDDTIDADVAEAIGTPPTPTSTAPVLDPSVVTPDGPDLQLYLSPGSVGSVTGGRMVSPLKGNLGTQLYALPTDVDLVTLDNVVIWCERFSVPFGTATLTG